MKNRNGTKITLSNKKNVRNKIMKVGFRQISNFNVYFSSSRSFSSKQVNRL